MEETHRKFDADFKEGAVRLVRETGKPIAQVAREFGIKEGTLGNWVGADRRRALPGGADARLIGPARPLTRTRPMPPGSTSRRGQTKG